MHGKFDRSDETTDGGIVRSFGIGVVVLPVVVVALLVGLAITKPDVSRWISEAEQAQFVASGQEMGVLPAEAGRPPQVRTVKAY